MKTYRMFSILAGALLLIPGAQAHAQDIACNVTMTAAAAGSNSQAIGQFRFTGVEDPLSIEVEVTHNVAAATSIEIRAGVIGQTGALITNLGGQTASPSSYTLTTNEAEAILAAGINWYVIVSSGAFPSPSGAIRVDGFTCLNGGPQEGEGTADGEAEGVPEGLDDYSCNFQLTGAQVVPPNVTVATGAVTTSFVSASEAQIQVQANLQGQSGEVYVYKGEVGSNGEQVRRLGNLGVGIPFLQLTISQAELEQYTSSPHYVQIDAGSSTIRGDIVGCEFDDGVANEGEGEGLSFEGEGSEEGQVDCLLFDAEPPANLICDIDLTNDQVVPPTTSSYVGRLQLSGPVEPNNQFLLVVRHNVVDPTSIGIYFGSPGEQGTLFLGFSSNLQCPFGALLPGSFLQVLEQNPMYIEIVASGDSNATIRADLACAVVGEGEGEGIVEGSVEGGVEGSIEGEGEEPNDLVGIADFLLLTFPLIDANASGRLSTQEATTSIPTLTGEQFQTLDSNGDGGLSPGELHRYAGPVRLHNADADGDKLFSLSELLRVVQLYSAGAYGCVDVPGDTEDGFEPVLDKADAKGEVLPCLRHAADYQENGDFTISLTELLRMIQLFHFGTYSYCPSQGEDAYCTEVESE